MKILGNGRRVNFDIFPIFFSIFWLGNGKFSLIMIIR